MDTLYKEYVAQRIVDKNDLSGSRLKITTINDDFKDWYRTLYGNTKGCVQAIKDLKPYLESQFGKYSSSGWVIISLSDKESEPEITEKFKILQQINIKMSDINKLIHDLLKLKTTEMLVMEADLNFYKEKYIANN